MSIPWSALKFPFGRHDVSPAADVMLAPASRPRRQKDLAIETLRGVAILLMVTGHVIGDTIASGLRVAEDSGYRQAYFMMQYLRMPLFTVISGFVYALFPVTFPTAGRFLSRKMERLFLPLFTIGTLQYVLHSLLPGTNSHPPLNQIWMTYVSGHDQFWFLHAIFLVFLTVVLLDGYQLMRTVPRWLGCLGVATLLSLFGPRSELFSFTGYLYLLPYFTLGCGLYRFPDRIFRREVVLAAVLLLVGGLFLQRQIWLGNLRFADERINWVSVAVGLTGTTLLFAFRQPVRWLAWLGGYSYGIFLLHVFPVAGSRMGLMRLGVHNRGLLFTVGLLCGVLVPIGMERLIRRHRVSQYVILGERSRRVLVKGQGPERSGERGASAP